MNLPCLTSDLLAPVAHGFFTRAGGASSGVFAALNCGHGSSDQTEMVRINRARVAATMEVAPERLVSLRQIHSSAVAAIDAPGAAPTAPADAVVTALPGVALGILTADCMPILFADAEAGVVGAAHAGWRGALGGVIAATVDAMEARGAERGRIAAAIGPAIGQSAYEVGPEILDAFLDADPDAGQFFAPGDGDRLHLDLAGFGLERLREAGVGAAEWIGCCTYSDPVRFFSYRRSVHRREADYGRLISVIRLG